MNHEVVFTILYWVWANKVAILFVFIVIWKGGYIWKQFVHDPITGGNGYTRMYEFGRYLVLMGWVYLTYHYDTVRWDIYITATLGALAIAKLDKALDVLRDIKIYGKGKGVSDSNLDSNHSDTWVDVHDPEEHDQGHKPSSGEH